MNPVYFIPGWGTISPDDVQVFNTLAEAAAFRTRRNTGVAMGNAAQTDAEITAYLAHVSATATQYGFQSLTPTERAAILRQATTTGVTPPFPTTLPAPSAAQIAIADGYTSGMAARPPARGHNGQEDITVTNLPTDALLLEGAIHAMVVRG